MMKFNATAKPGNCLHRLIIPALIACMFAGCSTTPPPRGNGGGQVDPYRRTPADTYSREADSVSLLEFSDITAQAIAERISSIRDIRNATEPVLIYMGDLENRTATPSSDFRQIQRRVFISLVNSDIVRQYADIVQDPKMMDDIIQYLQHPDAAPDHVRRYPPERIYVLNGFFGEQERGNGAQSTYYFDFTMAHLQTGVTVFAEQYDMKQVR